MVLSVIPQTMFIFLDSKSQRHQNHKICSEVTEIFLNWWILPIALVELYQKVAASEACVAGLKKKLFSPKEQPSAQAEGKDTFRCNSNNRENPPIQQNWHNF